MFRPSINPLSLGLAALACLVASPGWAAITYELVPVGNPGNAPDELTGFGDVDHDYQIGKYEVTIGQYAAFLNAVAKTDTYSLYDTALGIEPTTRGISRTGTSGAYTYSVIGPDGIVNGQSGANRPITFVSWFDSARFANWMANGQPEGAQISTTTENGAYNLNGTTFGDVPVKNLINPNTSAAPTFYIPTANEWYKAAYYSPVLNLGSGGYYYYATQSDAEPGNVIGSGANQANWTVGGKFSVTQSGAGDDPQNYLTDVGAFTNSASFYGTFDQSGNVEEWNDLTGTSGSVRGARGGYWGTDTGFYFSSENTFYLTPSVRGIDIGFRLASPAVVPIPEPSTYAMALAGLACGAWQMVRRRRAR